MENRQNNERAIMLLKAQTQIYKQVKTIYGWCIIISILIAIGAPILSGFFPKVKDILALIGLLWTGGVLFPLKLVVKAWVKDAAKIQEEFDCMVFNLPWNRIFVGDKISTEVTANLSKQFLGNEQNLLNWYTFSKHKNEIENIFLCQRSNLTWDWRLRRQCAIILGLIVTVFFISEIILAIYLDKKLFDYLVEFLVPSSSFLLLGLETSIQHFEIAFAKRQKEKTLNILWEDSKCDSQKLTKERCRQIQDFLYIQRTTTVLVPDFLYNIMRDKFESDTKVAIDEYSKEEKT